MRNLIYGLLLAGIASGTAGHVTAQNIKINENKWQINYDDATKEVTYSYDNEAIINNASARVKKGDTYFLSSEYNKPELSSADVTDAFGNAKVYTLRYTDTRKPTIEQKFYFYSDRDYFFTEVMLISSSETSSNYLAPIYTTTESSFLSKNENNRILTVPFDNDGFIRYSSYPLAVDSVSFEVTAMFNGDTRKGLVVGSVEHDNWKTGIRFSTKDNEKLARLECFGGIAHLYTRDQVADGKEPKQEHGALKGTAIKSPKMMVGIFSDWRRGLETYGECCAELAPARTWGKMTAPFGWNSWGAMEIKVNYAGVCDVSDFIHDELTPNSFENDGTTFIVLDSWWNDNFAEGELRKFVSRCKNNGQIPGIYNCPFLCWKNAKDSKVEGTNGQYTYGDCMLKVNGEIRTINGDHSMACMDPTHPATQMRMKYDIDRFKKWGFQYIKIDFLNCGVVEADSYYDKNVTTGIQAYNAGMKHYMELCGDDIYLGASIAPLFPSQYTHSRRISCDTWGEMTENGGATGYELNSLSFGWWLDRVYHANDADHIVLVDKDDPNKLKEGANRGRVTSGVITGAYILGDNLSLSGKIPGTQETRDKVKKVTTNPDINAIAKLGHSFYPVEGYKASAVDRTEPFLMYDDGTYIYLAVFNFNPIIKIEGAINLDRLGIKAADIEFVKELWSGERVQLEGETIPYSVPKQDVKVYRLARNGASGISSATAAEEKEVSCSAADGLLTVWSSSKLLLQASLMNMQGMIYPLTLQDNGDCYVAAVNELPKGVYGLLVRDVKGSIFPTKFTL